MKNESKDYGTNVRVSWDVQAALVKERLVPNETYNHVIARRLGLVADTQTDGEKTV